MNVCCVKFQSARYLPACFTVAMLGIHIYFAMYDCNWNVCMRNAFALFFLLIYHLLIVHVFRSMNVTHQTKELTSRNLWFSSRQQYTLLSYVSSHLPSSMSPFDISIRFSQCRSTPYILSLATQKTRQIFRFKIHEIFRFFPTRVKFKIWNVHT